MRQKLPLKRKLLSNFRDICYEFLTEVCKTYYSAQQCAINIPRPLHLWSSLTSHTREPSFIRDLVKLADLGSWLLSIWLAIAHPNAFLLSWKSKEFYKILYLLLWVRVCKTNAFWRVYLALSLNHLTFSQPTSCFWYWLQAAADALLPELHRTDLISWLQPLLMHWHGNPAESHLTFMHVQSGRAEELMPCGQPITNQGWAMLGICSSRTFWGIFYSSTGRPTVIYIFYFLSWGNSGNVAWDPVETHSGSIHSQFRITDLTSGRWCWWVYCPLALPEMDSSESLGGTDRISKLAVVSLDSFSNKVLAYIRLCFLESTG